ncbi:MAG: hypothetical protein IKI71_03985 [Lachnospiraceae bacterium]|nr:hypothetical protein [Lachnospiraceae bacterium]
MRKVLRNFKRAVSIVLILCLIFTSQAFVTFAENVENNEETTEFVESTNEETELVETSEDLVGRALRALKKRLMRVRLKNQKMTLTSLLKQITQKNLKKMRLTT